MQYRRANIEGGMYFFTVTLAERNRRLLVEQVDILRRVVTEFVDYIHYNPVKHGLVARAADWPNSSIHRYIAAGVVDRDWGSGTGGNEENGYGE